MKLKSFLVCILAAASLTVSQEIVLAHGGGGHGGGGGGHGFGGRGDLFLVGEITVALVTVVSVDAIATFVVVVSAILMGAFSISDSMGSDIRIITSTTTHSGGHAGGGDGHGFAGNGGGHAVVGGWSGICEFTDRGSIPQVRGRVDDAIRKGEAWGECDLPKYF
jgi:hypothetical protein